MLTPGQTTLGTIRAAARQRADQVNSQFVTDAELNGYISSSYFELYDILIQKFGNDYDVATPFQITTDGINYLFALPTDFYKLLGVDLQLAGTPDGWLTLKPFMFIERNKYAFPNLQSVAGMRANIQYRLNANNLWLTPLPTAGQVLQLWYVPRPITLSDTGTITLNNVVATNTITINGSTFTAVVSGAVGAQFNVGITDSATATNLSLALFDANPPLAGISQSATNNVITLTVAAGSVSWSGSGTFAFALPDVAAGVPAKWGSQVDGVSGWEEYIVCDSAIKMTQKEESDCSILLAQKAALLARIEAAAENRDAGSPQTVADSKRANSVWGGGGYGGGGYFPEGGY